MAVIDASVYVALINAHESEHVSSWAWFEQAKAALEPVDQQQLARRAAVVTTRRP